MRTVLSYLILVGLPLLGLVAVIEKGKALHPPMAVGGDWKAELDQAPDGASCSSRRLSPAFTIQMVQSGTQLTLLLKEGADAELRGKISSARISARDRDLSVEFQAEVEKGERGDRLSGTLSLSECRESGTIRFAAVKNFQTRPLAVRER